MAVRRRIRANYAGKVAGPADGYFAGSEQNDAAIGAFCSASSCNTAEKWVNPVNGMMPLNGSEVPFRRELR